MSKVPTKNFSKGMYPPYSYEVICSLPGQDKLLTEQIIYYYSSSSGLTGGLGFQQDRDWSQQYDDSVLVNPSGLLINQTMFNDPNYQNLNQLSEQCSFYYPYLSPSPNETFIEDYDETLIYDQNSQGLVYSPDAPSMVQLPSQQYCNPNLFFSSSTTIVAATANTAITSATTTDPIMFRASSSSHQLNDSMNTQYMYQKLSFCTESPLGYTDFLYSLAFMNYYPECPELGILNHIYSILSISDQKKMDIFKDAVELLESKKQEKKRYINGNRKEGSTVYLYGMEDFDEYTSNSALNVIRLIFRCLIVLAARVESRMKLTSKKHAGLQLCALITFLSKGMVFYSYDGTFKYVDFLHVFKSLLHGMKSKGNSISSFCNDMIDEYERKNDDVYIPICKMLGIYDTK